MIFDHVMIDLETLGTRPGSTILSVGVVPFSARTGIADPADQLHLIVSRGDNERCGFAEDEATRRWWDEQSWEARETLRHAEEGGLAVRDALELLDTFLTACLPADARGRLAGGIWGNGSDFDNALLAEAYRLTGLTQPWPFWQNRCFRTLKGLRLVPEPVRQGTLHNALDDAAHQARWAVAILRRLYGA